MSTIEQTRQGIPTGTWKADTVHSSVAFEVPYAVATFGGEVTDFEATLEDGKLSGSAKIESIHVKEENLQAHLLSPEFFDAEKHPVVSFSASDIERDGDNVTVDGEITIKGITKPIELTGQVAEGGTDPWGNERIGFELETVIDRRDFDLKWNQTLPNGGLLVSNEVKLLVSVSAVKAA